MAEMALGQPISRADRARPTALRWQYADSVGRGGAAMPGRTVMLAGVLGIVVLLVTACAPYFGGGSVVTLTPLGPLVTVSWPAAVEDDDGQEVASYTIEVNGTPIATPVAAPATSCVLIGLAASTTYTISVTARDTANEWSGSMGGEAASLGRISAAYTTPAGAGGGATLGCVPTTDTDGEHTAEFITPTGATYRSTAPPLPGPPVRRRLSLMEGRLSIDLVTFDAA